jgi:hypothetical protein
MGDKHYTDEEVETAYRVLYESGEADVIFGNLLDKLWARINQISDQNQSSWLFKAKGAIHEAMKNVGDILPKPKRQRKTTAKKEQP